MLSFAISIELIAMFELAASGTVAHAAKTPFSCNQKRSLPAARLLLAVVATLSIFRTAVGIVSTAEADNCLFTGLCDMDAYSLAFQTLCTTWFIVARA